MKYGMTHNVMVSRNLVMSRMEHSIRSTHGNLKQTYRQETGDTELAGETQGKADVACIWSLLSQTILRAHQLLHKGIKLPSANGKRKLYEIMMPLSMIVMALQRNDEKPSQTARGPPESTYNDVRKYGPPLSMQQEVPLHFTKVHGKC